MINRGSIFEVLWFVLGGLMLAMGVDLSFQQGFGESWYYFLFGLLALGMYIIRRSQRIKRR